MASNILVLQANLVLVLRWDDVDLNSGVLRARGTKTARSRRTVKLSRAAFEALTDHLTRQLEEIDRAARGVRTASYSPQG